jgi:putative NADPH-quinone reductase
MPRAGRIRAQIRRGAQRMQRKIFIVDGHPDASPDRLIHALAGAYEKAARDAGGEVRMLRLADIEFALLRSAAEFAAPPDDPAILAARQNIEWAEHLVFVFPLWLGSAPAKLRALFEQVSRGGFVADTARGWRPRLRGKSARLIVTMGMPAFAYRLLFGGHGVKSIARSILGFAGVSPIRTTLLGAIETGDAAAHARRLARIADLGRRGQ